MNVTILNLRNALMRSPEYRAMDPLAERVNDYTRLLVFVLWRMR